MTARLVLLALLLAAGACARGDGPPPIVAGTPCAACGMEIQDLRFACERRDGRSWRAYDAIECLLRDRGARPEEAAWLVDHDRATLHRADSMWVVRGTFASPMGGGFAAFLDRADAASVAAETQGRVARLAEFAAEAP